MDARFHELTPPQKRLIPLLIAPFCLVPLLYHYRELSCRHLTAISGFPSEGDLRPAKEYIRKICGDIEAVTPHRS